MQKSHVKLVGENGNIFNLLGLCHRAAKEVRWTDEEWKAFFEEATQGSYEDALETIQKYFEVE